MGWILVAPSNRLRDFVVMPDVGANPAREITDGGEDAARQQSAFCRTWWLTFPLLVAFPLSSRGQTDHRCSPSSRREVGVVAFRSDPEQRNWQVFEPSS